jgi:hypothetical protein
MVPVLCHPTRSHGKKQSMSLSPTKSREGSSEKERYASASAS